MTTANSPLWRGPSVDISIVIFHARLKKKIMLISVTENSGNEDSIALSSSLRMFALDCCSATTGPNSHPPLLAQFRNNLTEVSASTTLKNACTRIF